MHEILVFTYFEDGMIDHIKSMYTGTSYKKKRF